MPFQTAINLALQWLTDSDVYYHKRHPSARGGVAQGYHWQKRRYTFVYSEITGYQVSALVNAYRWSGEKRYLALARQSAEFVTRIQAQADPRAGGGAVPHGLSLPGFEVRHQYFSFDAAMCLQGLLDLHALSPSADLLTAARGIGSWLVDRMQRENGTFRSMYDAETDTWEHPGENFFDDDGSLHAKHAIGLLKLARATDDPRYADAARRVCDWVLTLQDEDGAIRASAAVPQVVSHPHCYAVEGLLYAHYDLGDDRYLQAARRAADWLVAVQNRDGSINIEYKKPWRRMGRRIIEIIRPKRVIDATSQATRIWLILYYLDNDPRYLAAARRAAGFLQRMQCTTSNDRNALGGFYFWPNHPVMFTWGTMFALHALYALDNLDRGDGYSLLMRELF